MIARRFLSPRNHRSVVAQLRLFSQSTVARIDDPRALNSDTAPYTGTSKEKDKDEMMGSVTTKQGIRDNDSPPQKSRSSTSPSPKSKSSSNTSS